MAVIVRVALALVLGGAGLLKLSAPVSAAAGLAAFRVPERVRLPAVLFVATFELAIATGLLIGSNVAAYAGAALMAVFAVLIAGALARGRRGEPCACFGSRSRVGPAALARNVVLAAALIAVPGLPSGRLDATGWLVVALVVAFACIAVLAVAVLALAREVGILRLRLPPEAALDVAGEGPPLGSHLSLDRLGAGSDARLGLAIFSSDGCRLCQSLAPVVAAFGREPNVAVEVFDEVRDAEVWRDLRIPGSPFAVAVDSDGAVRAKGTFNSYGQLESIVATAERQVANAHA